MEVLVSMMSSVLAAGVLGVDHEQVESSDTRPKTKMSGLADPSVR
ncbi:hypothetical protein MPS_3790 [Mycobacterium pseudoshottsii JCM 15466]|nr:hypothetical protein MPS_3790 [Mycobacterium pseudoshottsii JCM 15466]